MESSSDKAATALVVGTGFGSRIQIPALRAAGFDVVGLVGSDPGRTAWRAKAGGVDRAFTDLADALAQTRPTAVAISSPPHLHHDHVMLAIAHGCHVICEKPFALDAAEAARMLGAADAAGLVHAVGHEFRFVPQGALLARRIAQGAIGAPRFFTLAQYSGYVAQYADDLPEWWFDPARGGGWLGAAGSHIVDQVRWQIGEVAAVSAILPKVSDLLHAVEDSFILRLDLANGAHGVIQQTAGAPGAQLDVCRIAGAAGSLWIDGAEVMEGSATGSGPLEMPADLALPPAAAGTDPRQASQEWQWLTAYELEPYAQLCRHFIAAIRGQRFTGFGSLPTFEDGLACMKVLDAARASARAGGSVVAIE